MQQNLVRKIIENKVGRIVIALFLLIVAIPLAIWNEQRIDLSGLAAKAEEISAVSDGAEQVVYVTGKIIGTELLGDGDFLVPGNYLALKREVKMYAWAERTQNANSANYEYYKEWTSKPQNSKLFHNSSTYQNPLPAYGELEKRLDTGEINGYQVAFKDLRMPSPEKLTLSSDQVVLSNYAKLAEDTIYWGNGNTLSPQLGDLKISYTALNSDQEVTIFGKKQGQSIVPFVKQGTTLFQLETGNKDQALTALAKSYQYSLWGIRILSVIFVLIAIFAFVQVFRKKEAQSL